MKSVIPNLFHGFRIQRIFPITGRTSGIIWCACFDLSSENTFNIPSLTSVYVVLPIIFILVFLVLFYSFALRVTNSSRAALAATFTALFASLLFLPLEVILGFPQHALLSRLTFMSSF